MLLCEIFFEVLFSSSRDVTYSVTCTLADSTGLCTIYFDFVASSADNEDAVKIALALKTMSFAYFLHVSFKYFQ